MSWIPNMHAEVILPADWRAYTDGWSFERLGYPKPPRAAHGPEKRRGFVRLLDACPAHIRDGAFADALKRLSDEDRAGFFFDAGRAAASAA